MAKSGEICYNYLMSRCSRFFVGTAALLVLGIPSAAAYSLLEDPSAGSDTTLSGNGITAMFTYLGVLYQWAVGVAGGICVVWGVYGGILMMLAGSDTAKFSSGKSHMVAAIIGLLVMLFIGTILRLVNPYAFQ
jgi:hypothetical protein